MAFNLQSKGHHVAVNGFMANAFACITLFIREEGATTLVGSGKTFTQSAVASLAGESGAGRASIAGESQVVLLVIKPLPPIKSSMVWTTATGTPVTTLLHAEDT